MSTSVQNIERNGFPFVLETTCFKDRCKACNGNGFTTYATFGDYRALVWAKECGNEDAELVETGRKGCERCEGTGIFVGDPEVISFKVSVNSSLIHLP